MIHVHGVAFPDADRFMAAQMSPAGTYQIANLEAALRHVRTFSGAIDCGAHVGLWTRVMATKFAAVLAFEPSPDTFECLQANTQHLTNVSLIAAAVGAAPGGVSMALDAANQQRGNTGARFTRSGGDLPMVTIDGLGLADVGFIKLDIEGSEPDALEGAHETIRRCRPVILFEAKKLWVKHHGRTEDAVEKILRHHGYRRCERVSCDEIWGAQ